MLQLNSFIYGNHLSSLTFVYAFNKIEERYPLWGSLRTHNAHVLRMIVGDFNNVFHVDERLANMVTDAETQPFLDVIDDCEPVDMKATVPFFTWNNKQDSMIRVYNRLDGVLINEE